MYRATQGLAVLKLKLSGVSGVSRTDEGWRVVLELVERAAVPDTMDLLGVYEVQLDHDGRADRLRADPYPPALRSGRESGLR